MNDSVKHPASYKDPAGFVFRQGNIFYRQVNFIYKEQYDLLMRSGLYNELIHRNWLIPHEEIARHPGLDEQAYKVLLPVQIKHISYPYEWSFDMLKDAALLTLQINQLAISYGMILKDASAFNVQFVNGKPVFIDSLSFDLYNPSQPWIAYRQFCNHFLFPLLIAHYNEIDAIRWLRVYMNGLSTDLTAKLMPFSTRFRLGTVLHVHLQNRLKNKQGSESVNSGFSAVKMNQLLTHLQEVIGKLHLKSNFSTWNVYYDSTILSKEYLEEKEQVFRSYLRSIEVNSAIDLGSNNGYFSNLLAAGGVEVIAIDSDAVAVNDLYRSVKKRNESRILPMVIDLSNPSPDLGWQNIERTSFLSRAKADLVLALALVHHLYFGFNLPLKKILCQLYDLADKYCIVEFVLPDDEKVKLISDSRKELLKWYTIEEFETACSLYFTIVKKTDMVNAKRIMYLLKK